MSTKKPSTNQTKPSQGAKTLAKARKELQQESASLQILGRALTPEEQAGVKALEGAIQLVSRALKAL